MMEGHLKSWYKNKLKNLIQVYESDKFIIIHKWKKPHLGKDAHHV